MEKLPEKSSKGWVNGFIGVLIFSGSLPATRIAVMGFNPIFVTVARASVAGLLAVFVLLFFNQRRPTKKQFSQLIVTAIGVVIGFPLFSAMALKHITSASSVVFIGILPLLTAIFGVIRNEEKPHPAFWLFSILGASLVVGFAVYQGVSNSPTGNLLMLLAVVLCGLGYAEGAKLSKSLGGWQVISWALAIALPLMILLLFYFFPPTLRGISIASWLGLGYVSVFSMFIGFIFWYRGLAQGGTASVSQLQLLQPFFGLALATSLLQEEVSTLMMLVTIGVILCVVASRKFAG
ncbi:DMT family transporter [Pedobacter arcticus]|uniref:DMT family transporter n=1 Tax=Pedobacter arcticus TaxID=752140 RepID=UPI000310581C|nr:DMT family transporter [Pedobacter arcticus]